MPTPYIIIVGSNFSGRDQYFADHSIDFVVLKDRQATRFPDKRFKRRVVCDFDNPSSVIEAAKKLHAERQVTGVISFYEQYITIAAAIASELGLPALPKDAAIACTDKQVMRERFAAAPEKISPDFAEVTSVETLRSFASSHAFPLILKPANLSKSLLVSKNDSLEELLQNYQKTMANIGRVYAKYAPHTTPKLLVEEFMMGSIHSVDAFVDKDGDPHVLPYVVDYQTGHDIGFADNFHYSRLLPSQLSEADQTALRNCAALGIEALGMKNTPAHVEIIMTVDGPRIVEIGARNGGYRERMHGMANGLDVMGDAIRLAMGEQPAAQGIRNDPVGVFELFPKEPGTFVGIKNETQLRELASLEYLSVKAVPGEFVGSSSDGYKMCAIVILHNENAQQFAKDMTFLNHHVAVQTRSET